MNPPKTLAEIGIIMGRCFDLIYSEIDSQNLTKEDLNNYSQYVDHQATSMPILYPGTYQNKGEYLLPIAKRRVEILQIILKDWDETIEFLRKNGVGP